MPVRLEVVFELFALARTFRFLSRFRSGPVCISSLDRDPPPFDLRAVSRQLTESAGSEKKHEDGQIQSAERPIFRPAPECPWLADVRPDMKSTRKVISFFRSAQAKGVGSFGCASPFLLQDARELRKSRSAGGPVTQFRMLFLQNFISVQVKQNA